MAHGQVTPAPLVLRQVPGKAGLVLHILAFPHQRLLLSGLCPKGQGTVSSHCHHGALCPPCTRQARVRADSHVGWGDRNLPSGLQGTPWVGLGPGRPLLGEGLLGEGGWRRGGLPPGPRGTSRGPARLRTLGARPGSRGQSPSGREAAPPGPEPTSYFTTRGGGGENCGQRPGLLPPPCALRPAREGWRPGRGSGCSQQDGGRGRR